jgi:hypothetical protein
MRNQLIACEIVGVLAPEDARRIRPDLGEERVDVRGWADAVVKVPAQVAVTPVEHPNAVCLDVAEAGDREPRPIRADLGRPRRSALQDRDRPTTHIELDPDLVAQAGRDASFAEAPDSREVEVGKDGLGRGHGA